MLISHRHKFVFVHVPKTGGNAVAEALLPFADLGGVDDGWKHSTAVRLKDRLGDDAWRAMFKFAFVRNPWDWLVSHYFYAKEWSQKSIPPHLANWKANVDRVSAMSFEQFVRTECRDPYVTYRLDLVDSVGRQETLQDDLKKVCREIEIPCPTLRRANETAKRPSRERCYTPELAEVVRRRFKKFIERFGYEFTIKRYCRSPFEQIKLNSNGNAYCCCQSWIGKPIGSWRQSTLEEIWNGPEVTSIRESVLDGTYKYCNRNRCPVLQDRQHYLWRTTETTPAVNLVALTLGIERTCNLKCPTCRTGVICEDIPEDSRKMRLAKAVAQRFNDGAICALSLTGNGEPLVAHTSLCVLRNIKVTGANRNGRIVLHTNGLLLRKRWPSYANCHSITRQLSISIDAAHPKTYEMNRGGQWKDLLENLDYARKTFSLITLNFVVQTNNYREMSDFVELAQSFGCRARFTPIQNWAFPAHEYANRAVHKPVHPQFSSFLTCLRQLPSDGVLVEGFACAERGTDARTKKKGNT